MPIAETVNDLRAALGDVLASEFRGDTRVVVPAEKVYDVLELLKEKHGFDLLIDITCVDYLNYPRAKDRFGLVYLLDGTATRAPCTSGRRLTVRAFVNEPQPAVRSVVALWEGANWLEREVWDMFGIHFEGHPDLRRILMPEEFAAFPLRKDYPLQGLGERHNFPVLTRGELDVMPLTLSELADDQTQNGGRPYLWTMNFGPQHPATHTTLRLVLKLDGERVADAIPDIGFLHSGFEKIGESLDFNQYVTVTDRMNYISPMSNNVAWHMAVEKLLGIEVTPRCSYIRTIACELMRLSDHLLCLGAMGLDVGAITHFMYTFNARESIYDIAEALCGARFTNSYTRVGGVMRDITPLVVDMTRKFLAEMPGVMDDMDRLMGKNRIFVDRMQGVGLLTKDEAINRSCSGPVARASGVVRDLRRDEPYLSYADFDFQVCCAREGDCLARYQVRMAEMQESIKILHQALENIPPGPVNVGPDRRSILPPPGKVWTTIEGLISHFELVMPNRGMPVPNEEVYCATEAPNGELGFYVVGDGSPRAYRARCRPPSFINFALFPHLIRGHTLSDVVAVLGSLNIIAAELDR